MPVGRLEVASQSETIRRPHAKEGSQPTCYDGDAAECASTEDGALCEHHLGTLLLTCSPMSRSAVSTGQARSRLQRSLQSQQHSLSKTGGPPRDWVIHVQGVVLGSRAAHSGGRMRAAPGPRPDGPAPERPPRSLAPPRTRFLRFTSTSAGRCAGVPCSHRLL